MANHTAVYAQIVPQPGILATGYLLRVLLPYGPTTMPSDVRVSWPAVERRLRRAVRQARHEGETPLPPQLEDCLAVEFTIPDGWLADPGIDLAQAIIPDLQRTVIAALRGRDADRRN